MPKPYIGGQAVMEGVMMRSPRSFVVVVRRPDGKIAIRELPWMTLLGSLKFLRWPLLRGALVLIESLHNGFSALKFSAEHSMPESPASAGTDRESQTSTSLLLLFATVLMVLVFIALPHLLTFGIGKLVGPALDTRGAMFHLVDGLLRVAILVGYIAAISRTEDAARLFQYHGAEHKAIWAYESGGPLTVDNARRFSTFHPRCGTSFLFIVVSVAILIHLALVPLVPRMHANDLVNQLLLVLVKVPMALPIAGFAYELQRISAKPNCPRLVQWLVRPGVWMQRITTREPTTDQLEIAVLALERALAREEGRSKAPDGVAIYQDFAVAAAAA